MTTDTVKQGVKEILKRHPKARDSYNWLWYYYCREIAQIPIYVPFTALNSHKILPSVEGVGRAARKLVEEAKLQESYNKSAIMPSPLTQQNRALNEQRVREWATKTHKGGSGSPVEMKVVTVGKTPFFGTPISSGTF